MAHTKNVIVTLVLPVRVNLEIDPDILSDPAKIEEVQNSIREAGCTAIKQTEVTPHNIVIHDCEISELVD